MKNITEHLFTGTTSNTYDYNKTYLGATGSFIIQNSGSGPSDKYVSVFPISVARPMEATTAIASGYPYIINWSSTKNWVFLVDIAATTTKRVIMYEHDLTNNSFSWVGGVSMATPGGNITARGFRMTYDTYSTGTASVSGTTVTGIGTEWTDSRFASGSRIGFGTTDPTLVTNWYEISDIGSNTSITLLSTAGTIGEGPYIIEELRAVLSCSSATVANGGLFLIKGLNPSAFTPTPLVISYATNVDNIRAVYWLADAAVVTMQAPWGLSIDVKTSNTNQDVYIPAGAVAANSYFIYKYNLRAALSPTSGKTTDAYLYRTGAINAALVGTVILSNNARLCTLNHSPVNGEKCLYFVTTTRIYRCRLSEITNGGVGYIIDSMVEVPPGGGTTYTVSSFTSVEESTLIDMLIVGGSATGRSYITKYYADSSPMDVIFLANDLQSDQSSADSSAPAHPGTMGTVLSFYSEGGRLYICRNGTAALSNQLYCLPLKSHRYWADTTGEFIITPKLSTIGAIRYYRVYVNSDGQRGDSTFGCPTEDYDLLYRISGIDDNTGEWIDISDDGDMTGVVSDYIQFKIRFKVLGTWCIPTRIYSIALVYEDSNTDSHYSPSVNKSSATNRIFGYRQSLAWGSNIPSLRMRLYNSSTGSLILDDTVDASSSGTWQYSTNGTDWNSWSSSADLVGNYIRYTATTLPSSIVVRALLTQ